MKEIVVISGKGGTGKTSLTGSFAVLAQNAVIADCDVDAADLHLLLAPEVEKTETFISGHEAIIDSKTCISCGLCQEICRFDAIENRNGSFAVKEIGCEGCKVCVEFCPEGAISFPESDCGEWYRSQTQWGEMVHARLKAGAENSGKLVSLVRSEAKKIAGTEGGNWIIVDGPPGIGCPVISSVSGVSAALIVTEPTLSGMHDLKRVASLANHFKVQTFIVINKYDLNRHISSEIEEFAKRNGIQMIGKLPYSPLFNRAQIAGEPILTHAPDSSESKLLTEIYETLMTELSGELYE